MRLMGDRRVIIRMRVHLKHSFCNNCSYIVGDGAAQPTVHLSPASSRSGRSGISSRLLGRWTSPFLPRDSDACLLFSAASAITLRSTDLLVAVCSGEAVVGTEKEEEGEVRKLA